MIYFHQRPQYAGRQKPRTRIPELDTHRGPCLTSPAACSIPPLPNDYVPPLQPPTLINKLRLMGLQEHLIVKAPKQSNYLV